MSLEALLAKALSLGVDLSKVRLVHVDDEPLVLEQLQSELAGVIGNYAGFTDPKDALTYIKTHLDAVDFLILDQFITRDMKRLVGFQGTDILQSLVGDGVVKPAIIYSGDHARADCFTLLKAVNGATDVASFMDQAMVLRKGNFAPVAYVNKSAPLDEVALNMIGLLAMHQESLSAGYAKFFQSFEPPISSSGKRDIAQLAYEKGAILLAQAIRFSKAFKAFPGADLMDGDRRFSDKFVDYCNFEDALNYTPEELSGLDSVKLDYWAHEYSRAYRAIYGAESRSINEYYLRLVKEFMKTRSFTGTTEEFLRANPEIEQGYREVESFRYSMMKLAGEMYCLRNAIQSTSRYLERAHLKFLDQFTPSLVGSVEFGPELEGYTLLTDRILWEFIFPEIVYNAIKVAQNRGLNPLVKVNASDVLWENLPDSGRTSFTSKRTLEYLAPNGQVINPNIPQQDYVKVTIEDNSGGFEGEISDHIGVSGTGSTGFGLAHILNAQEELCASITVTNKPGQGAVFDFYFLKSD